MIDIKVNVNMNIRKVTPLDHGKIKDLQIDRQKYHQVESLGFL